jgi:hypothetical protein
MSDYESWVVGVFVLFALGVGLFVAHFIILR